MVSHTGTGVRAGDRALTLHHGRAYMANLSKKQKLLIYEMINKDFSDKDIARMADVDVDVIKKFRFGGNRNDKKIDGNKKRAGSKRDFNPSGHESKDDKNRNRDEPEPPVQENKGDRNNSGSEKRKSESEGSTGAPGSGITFVGGKKTMDKKEGSGAKEEDEYQCHNCGHVQGTPFTECPKCGSSNSFEE